MKDRAVETDSAGTSHSAGLPPEIVRKIVEVIRTVQFGSVEVIIQDARVIQIERKEKFRFDRPQRS